MTNAPSWHITFVGAGHIAREHLAALSRLGLSPAVTVVDPHDGAVAEFTASTTLGVERAASLDEALASEPGPDDVVVVCTPPALHADMAIRSLRSGRHVLCEKPFAMTAEEAMRMAAVAAEVGRELHCCSVRFLGNAGTERVRELLEAGELGPPYRLLWRHRYARARTGIEYQPVSRWFLDRSRNGGGTLMDWGPYDLATILDLLDARAVTVLSAWTTAPETWTDLEPGTVNDVEQHVGAQLQVIGGDGAVVTVDYERAACVHGPEEAVFRLEGSQASAQWDWLNLDGTSDVIMWSDDHGAPVVRTDTVTQHTDYGHHDRPIRGMRAALEGTAAEMMRADRAAFAFRVLRAIYDVAGGARGEEIAR